MSNSSVLVFVRFVFEPGIWIPSNSGPADGCFGKMLAVSFLKVAVGQKRIPTLFSDNRPKPIRCLGLGLWTQDIRKTLGLAPKARFQETFPFCFSPFPLFSSWFYLFLPIFMGLRLLSLSLCRFEVLQEDAPRRALERRRHLNQEASGVDRWAVKSGQGDGANVLAPYLFIYLLFF